MCSPTGGLVENKGAYFIGIIYLSSLLTTNKIVIHSNGTLGVAASHGLSGQRELLQRRLQENPFPVLGARRAESRVVCNDMFVFISYVYESNSLM